MLPNASFTGVSPDGTLYVTNAHQNGVGPRAGGPGAVGDPDAKVFETDTAKEVLNTGVPVGAMTPMFTPDGAMLAFTDYAISQGHGMAVMNFDRMARKASAYRKVYTQSDMMYPAWPFFLPDDKALVFAIGSAADFSGMGIGINMMTTTANAPKSDLFVVDLATGTATMLAKAMGFASELDIAADKTYLPFGAAEELHHHYYPTVAPVPAGGYFWAFFDSWRHYGNQGLQRQLWGTAIDVSPDGSYAKDPSHPAFYLTGQEPNTGNHRAFAALDPCMMNGETCTSGTDCCGGFCYVKDDTSEFGSEPIGKCTSDVPMCSKVNERCTTSADCCPPPPNQPPYICIASVCAVVPPVQ
jgi:Tol biopolymer transport system component